MKHLGALAEIMACEWLIRQGYEIFRNISAHGLADYVAWKPGETPILIDVKSIGGYPRPTKAQQAAGVRILYVDRDRRKFSFDRSVAVTWHKLIAAERPASLQLSHEDDANSDETVDDFENDRRLAG